MTTRASATALLRRTPLAAGRVRKVPLPDAVRARTTLGPLDYEDCYLADVPGACERTAEEWARATLEGPPLPIRAALGAGWSSLGLRRGGAPRERSVHGWEIRSRSDDFVLLAARSPLGLAAEVLFEREPGTLVFATFVRLDTAVARAAWTGVPPLHHQVVLYLLEAAASGATASTTPR